MVKTLGLQLAAVLLMLTVPASIATCVLLLLYGAQHGRALIMGQAVVFLLFACMMLMASAALQDFINGHWSKVRLAHRRRRYAPQLAAWRASLLQADSQPDGRVLSRLEKDEIEGKLKRTSVFMDHLQEMDLWIYRDPRPHGAYWIGQLNEANPAHSRWWYSMHPYHPDEWHACSHEFMAQLAGGREQPAPGDAIALSDLFSVLLGSNKGAFEATLSLVRAHGLPSKRDEPWLQHFIQTFGHADPAIIVKMPQQVNWDEVHQILHHHADWQATNDAPGMPQAMALRMYGLGSLLEVFEPAELLARTSANQR